VGVASVGAQRRTLLIDLVENGTRVPAVAQLAAGELAELSVEAQASLLREAGRSGVPVPRLIAWDAALGAVVTARVAGESIPRRILRLVDAQPALGDRLAAQCGRALAALHRMSVAKLPGLPDLREPLDYVDRLSALYQRLELPIPALRLGLNWLLRSPPARPPAPAVVHGDFRNGNLLVSEDGLTAVLDWELAHTGDPMEDLAWLCLRTWRFGNDDREAGGFARISRLREAYEHSGGTWRDDAFAWWTVARTVWWGLGLAWQAQSTLRGSSPSIVLAASGRRVVELEYDLLTLIG